MKKIQVLLSIVLAISCYSCKNSSNNNKTTDSITSAQTTVSSTSSAETADSIKHAALNKLTIANENDPACGMPMLRGFEDTTMYKGKLIGFCSKECKDNFLKKPASYPIVYAKTGSSKHK